MGNPRFDFDFDRALDVEVEVAVTSASAPALHRARGSAWVRRVLEHGALGVSVELEGLGMEEITQGMQCPLKTTYSRLRLAREAVRTRAAAEGGPHGR